MNFTSNSSRCISWRNFTNSQSDSSVRYWSEICLLSSFNIFVIVGNCFVLLALLIDRHLRTPTHYFIGSLAIADLALGLLVLPFATTLHVRGYWIFGSIFCQLWLAFDVWLCTASIYSLIAVTFDRYVAVTKPLTYKLVMTRKKATILIGVVWTAALVICLPAFASSLHRAYYVTSITCQCTQMAHSVAYIAYSSIGSFYLPMTIIVYLYARIYGTVRKIRLSGSTGIVSMAKASVANGGATAITAVNPNYNQAAAAANAQHESLLDKGPQLSGGNLRVHKGRYQPVKGPSARKKGMVDRPSVERFDLKMAGEEKIQKDNEKEMGNGETMSEIVVVEEIHVDEPDANTLSMTGIGNRAFNEDNLDVRFLTVNSAAPSCQSSVSSTPRGSMTETKMLEQEINEAASSRSRRSNSATMMADLWLHLIMPSQLTSLWCQRMALLQKYQKKFALELRALKTVCIVTGCFIICWLGFCIVYTMQALPYCRVSTWDSKSISQSSTSLNVTRTLTVHSGQTSLARSSLAATGSRSSTIGSCVPDWITNIMVWLGYVNSAMNPIIYGISNKQFRRTFRRILRCDISFKKHSSQSTLRRKDAYGHQKST